MAFQYRPDEPQFSNFSPNPLSPPRNPNRLSAGVMASNTAEGRGNMTRRFTTNGLPTLSPIGQQRLQAAGDTQMVSDRFSLPDNGQEAVGDVAEAVARIVHSHAMGKVADLIMGSEPSPGLVGDWHGGQSERKIRQVEALLEQQRRINAELEQVDDQTRREVEQGLRHERAVSQMIAQSEPTTPPEYQDAFATSAARPNRYSMNSLTSPVGLTNRPNRSSTQLTSPIAGLARPYTSHASNMPQSVPGSRRHSDDEEDDDFIFGGYDAGIHRAAANPNRNSMPVTTYDRKRNTTDFSSGFGPLNTTSFLFDDDDQPASLANKSSHKTTPPDAKTYLQLHHTADGFPKLIRRDDNGDLVSGPSAALDLALSKTDKQVSERGTATRHRISLPPSALSSGGNIAPLNSILASANDSKSAATNRRSMEVKFTAETKRPALMATPPRNMANGILKAQSSYSTNDIPTLKSINGDAHTGGVSLTSPSTQSKNVSEVASPEQSARNGVTSDSSLVRHSQELTNQNGSLDFYSTPHSGLQGTAAAFAAMHDQNQQPFTSPTMSPYAQQAYYPGYGMQMLNNGFNGMNIGNGYGGQGQWSGQGPAFQQPGYGGYQQFSQAMQSGPGAGRFSENNRANMQNRKAMADDFYSNANVAELRGQIYALCKDQHGCRFLQKKLEERNTQDTQIIFDEVKEHFCELMMDPFGNYLCQRLLEHASEDQRTALISIATPEMTRIALNQHGTRALQRMIEYITTPEQTQLIIDALESDVVQLIQDLNGNHVIQKCLNHLTPEDAQFIFDAVAGACVIVGTHRHGCCVLQRCVDHATGLQKGALVDAIIGEAFALVQDPFGNYVVQYILDLTEPCFTEPLCHSFQGKVVHLSKQKFSSNVIEKCIRCASRDTKRMLIQEILPPFELEKLLRDNYANYVVQTALDSADEELKLVLVDNIRPILPSLRHTPHGRRLQSKITDWEATSAGLLPPSINPPATDTSHSMPSNHSMMSTAGPYSSHSQHSTHAPHSGGGRANRMGMIGAPPAWANANFSSASSTYGGPNDIIAPTPQRGQDYNFLNGGQPYQNHALGNPTFRQAPSYNHF
ncbi:uncharacterized protein LTR77_002721 [Saxophila tyrrhenica]|uniref:PUM-HD domain-containing protein n=1 Tax=Saxophila tyrrhenica TaxID=1690608 RepID=A0AAV9PG08_9PEZI|nr:hypothetical protein LTR77_002721 [Saxophila tyrrhenica]